MERSKMRHVATLMAALVLVVAGSALGQVDPPTSSCPPGFHLHRMSDHHGHGDHHAHRHVGTSADQNGDGWTCVKHVSADGSVHVHVDNAVRVR